jgi:hypothetical protein
MGYNNSGQLGNGKNFGSTNIPIQIAGLTIASLGACSTANHSLVTGAFSPQISSLSNRIVNLGQPASFTFAVTNGDGPFTYQWQFNGTNMSNATNIGYNIASVALTNLGTYSVIVTGVGNSTSQSATLTVNVLHALMTVGNVLQTNGTWQLSVRLTGSPNYPYIVQTATNLTPPVSWQPIFTNPADGNGNWTFTITNLTDLPAGYYRAVAQ